MQFSLIYTLTDAYPINDSHAGTEDSSARMTTKNSDLDLEVTAGEVFFPAAPVKGKMKRKEMESTQKKSAYSKYMP